MKCKKAERLILLSLDGRLKPEDKINLENHLKNCPFCQMRRKEYISLRETLRSEDFPEPLPNFWERLQPKLKERRKFEPWPLWKQWGMRAIPLSLLIVAFLAVAVLVFMPQQQEELSQSEVLLLRDINPFQETRELLEEEKVENKNMMLIFTSLEEQNDARRYLP